jgi:CheY-like chemotaxis protein
VAESPNESGQHRVMVVEDHPDTRELYAVILTVHGFEVTTPASAATAFEELRKELRPCVVLLDFHMPDGDAWTFVDRLRRQPRCADLPVVVVSGDLDQRLPAKERGFEFLAKPMDPADLIAAIERHCDRHRGRVLVMTPPRR